MIMGIAILVWCFIGPFVGYKLAVRGWRFRSPFTRSTEEEL